MLPDTCQVSDLVNNLFKQCVRPYSIYNEEKGNMDISWRFSSKANTSKDEVKNRQRRSKSKVRAGIDGNKGGSSGKSILRAIRNWVIAKKYVQNVQSGKLIPFPMHWRYHGANELGELPYFGKFATYSGGGYVIDLGSDFEYAKAAVVSSYQDRWIDAQTRAVFFEFTVFNMNTKYYATASVVAEIIPTGKIVTTGKIHVFRLNRYEGIGGKLILSSEIILLLLILFFLYKDARYIFKIGLREYWKRFWSWIDMTITTALISGMVLWFVRWYQKYQIMLRLKKSKNYFISFQYAAIADEMLNTSIAFVIFFSILKLIKFLSILPTIVILKGTILKSMRPLVYFSLQFVIPFVGFAMFANLAFFQVEGFSTTVRTTVTQCQMLLGGSVFKTLKEMPMVLVSFYFCLFVIFETFILMNMFMVILCESLNNSSSTLELQQEDLEFIDFAFAKLIDTFHFCFPMDNQRSEVPPPEETTAPLLGVKSQHQEVDQTVSLHRSEVPASKQMKKVDLQDVHVEVDRKVSHHRYKAPSITETAPATSDVELNLREVDEKQRLLENLIAEIESRFDATDEEWRDYYEKKLDMFFDTLLCQADDYTFDSQCDVKIADKVKKMSVAEFLR